MASVIPLHVICRKLEALAVKKQRPSYELPVAKDIQYCLKKGLYHPLIQELPFFEIEKPLDLTHVHRNRTHK